MSTNDNDGTVQSVLANLNFLGKAIDEKRGYYNSFKITILSQIDAISQAIEELLSNSGDLNSRLKKLNETIKELQDEINRTGDENDRLKNEIEDLNNEKSSITQQIRGINNEIAKIQAIVNGLDTESYNKIIQRLNGVLNRLGKPPIEPGQTSIVGPEGPGNNTGRGITGFASPNEPVFEGQPGNFGSIGSRPPPGLTRPGPGENLGWSPNTSRSNSFSSLSPRAPSIGDPFGSRSSSFSFGDNYPENEDFTESNPQGENENKTIGGKRRYRRYRKYTNKRMTKKHTRRHKTRKNMKQRGGFIAIFKQKQKTPTPSNTVTNYEKKHKKTKKHKKNKDYNKDRMFRT
jgi:prefoldin subunit 5